jgi:hypothetical protein
MPEFLFSIAFLLWARLDAAFGWSTKNTETCFLAAAVYYVHSAIANAGGDTGVSI